MRHRSITCSLLAWVTQAGRADNQERVQKVGVLMSVRASADKNFM